MLSCVFASVYAQASDHLQTRNPWFHFPNIFTQGQQVLRDQMTGIIAVEAKGKDYTCMYEQFDPAWKAKL